MSTGKDTRCRALNAATHKFSDKGHHDAHVDEIVEAAETSKDGA
jgi:hypothetical protein